MMQLDNTQLPLPSAAEVIGRTQFRNCTLNVQPKNVYSLRFIVYEFKVKMIINLLQKCRTNCGGSSEILGIRLQTVCSAVSEFRTAVRHTVAQVASPRRCN